MNRLSAFALAALLATSAQAANQPLAADGQWNLFAVSDAGSQSGGTEWIADDGSALQFHFDVAAGFVARLTVVDGVFAGDTFTVTDNGLAIGGTSAVPTQSYDSAPGVGYDFDAALADPRFSSATFTLGAGSHVISGALAQSVLLDGAPLNSTEGALRLTISAVPEASTTLSLLAGLGLFAIGALRRKP